MATQTKKVTELTNKDMEDTNNINVDLTTWTKQPGGMKVIITHILSIMKSPVGYSYNNPKGGEFGTIRFGGVLTKVPAEAYERAYVINETLGAMEEWPMEKVYAVKKAMIL